jgi:hypothetical protein
MVRWCIILLAHRGTGGALEVVVKRPKTGQDVLEYEILGEQAATIGRLSRELRAALDALADFDRQETADRHDPRRIRLVDDAAYALWHFVVQRDCSGLRGTEHVLKGYGVPAEVRGRMGAPRRR